MQQIEYLAQNRIAFITLNRPEKRNALSPQLVAELGEAFLMAEQDDGVKVVVLRANGEAFCSGADLSYLQSMQNFSFDENLADSNRLKDLFQKIYTLDKVVIAQVQGHALAGGCGLATVCDFIYTIPDAKFGYTEVKIGFIPAIVMVFLLRKIGEMKTRELLLSGEPVSAQKAMDLGLITSIVAKDKLETDVLALAERLAENNSGTAMKITRHMISAVQSMSLDEALSFAAVKNAEARGTADCRKGIAAFLNKEKISW